MTNVTSKCAPASINQRRLWILDKLEPGNAAYHIPICVTLQGSLNVELLERSLTAIIKRHETLRTVFDMRDGGVVQIVNPNATSAAIQVTEISTEPSLDPPVRVLIQEEIKRPFDLASGPLVRTALFRLAPQLHIFVVTMHHIISDGHSAELLMRELAEHYEAFRSGRNPTLKPLPMSYSDFATLQVNSADSDYLRQQLTFWCRTLHGAPFTHELPLDYPRPERPSRAGATQIIRLDGDLVSALRRIGRDQRATFFMVVAAAFQVLLAKYSKRRDVLVGIPVSGRTIAEVEDLIGLFVNTVALRTPFIGDPTFIEVLSGVRETLLNAMSNQDVPFEQVVSAVNPPRKYGYNPIFQIMFSTFRAVEHKGFGQLTVTPYVVDKGVALFDLSFNIIEGNQDTWVQVEYSSELFVAPHIAKMLENYKLLLQSICDDPLRRLRDLPPKHSTAVAWRRLLRPRWHFARRTRSLGPMSLDYVEREVIEIWQEFLKLRPIAVDRDFFELGGNSLLAIEVMTKINRTFGKRLPVSTILRTPTIRAVARQLCGEDIYQSSFYPVVELGTKLPLFVASTLYRFRELSQALGPDQPFYQMDMYALQEERLSAGGEMIKTIEEIADEFTQRIVRIQPFGPYLLAGQCEGSIIALEIARQLRHRGQEVGALIQFDTPPSGFFNLFPAHHRFWRALTGKWLFHSIVYRLRNILDYGSQRRYIWDTLWSAIHAYGTERIFDGDITLIRATERIRYEDVTVGWDRIGKTRVIDVACDHDSVASHPSAHAAVRGVLEKWQKIDKLGMRHRLPNQQARKRTEPVP